MRLRVNRKLARVIASLAGLGLAGPLHAAEFRLSVADTGSRDYYCTVSVTVENGTAARLDDLNGVFDLLAGGGRVGSTRAGSFFAVAPGAAMTATFESPDAPCADIDGYRFLINSCRIDGQFLAADQCAGRITVVAPIQGVAPR